MDMERLKNYTIIGNAEELNGIIRHESMVRIAIREILAVLEKNRPNYVVVGVQRIEGKKCRLVYIYLTEGIGISELVGLIEGFGEDVIFGYGKGDELKIVSVWN